MNIQISLRFPEWMVSQVDQMACEQHRSRNNMFEILLLERLGKNVKPTKRQKPVKGIQSQDC